LNFKQFDISVIPYGRINIPVKRNKFGNIHSITFLDAVQNLSSSHLLSRNVKIKIYKTIISPVVLYGCDTLSLMLREEHRLKVFENTVLRRIFGPKRDEVTGGWRKVHNEELHGLYYTSGIVRVIKARRLRWAGHVAHMGEGEGCIQHFGWEA
jgi:hypothetical protein